MTRVLKDRVLLFGVLIVLASMAYAVAVYADNAVQTVEMVRVDVQRLSTGYRISKIMGSTVTNDAGDSIGKIDDMIVSSDDNKSAFVILSVGGWLGMGTHLVALPFSSLQITKNKIMLPGATKDGLKALPEFKYSST